MELGDRVGDVLELVLADCQVQQLREVAHPVRQVRHLRKSVRKLFRRYRRNLDLRNRKISIQEQLPCRHVKRFRRGIVFKAHRLLYDPTLDSREYLSRRR